MATEQAILDALEEQVNCYRRLARLTEAQREHVQQSHMEALIDVLRGRQEILDQLAGLESVIGPAKARWTDFLGEIELDARVRAEQLVGETKKLLEQIMASDRNDALALQQRKINLGRQINQASGARQINRNYATAAYGKRASTVNIQQ